MDITKLTVDENTVKAQLAADHATKFEQLRHFNTHAVAQAFKNSPKH